MLQHTTVLLSTSGLLRVHPPESASLVPGNTPSGGQKLTLPRSDPAPISLPHPGFAVLSLLPAHVRTMLWCPSAHCLFPPRTSSKVKKRREKSRAVWRGKKRRRPLVPFLLWTPALLPLPQCVVSAESDIRQSRGAPCHCTGLFTVGDLSLYVGALSLYWSHARHSLQRVTSAKVEVRPVTVRASSR